MGVHKTDAYPEVKKLLDIPEDEPIFILRGQDQLYTVMLASYEQFFLCACLASTVSEHAEDMWEFADQIEALRREGRTWQKKNEDRVKIPD